jgi:MFS transporter, MHS family, citrate/tricarballylate:H+ symporter
MPEVQATHEAPHWGLKRRYIAAVTIGNALEFYDFLIYTFFSIQIGRAFFPAASAYGSLMLSLATFGAGFLTRPVGAVVIGNLADRVGRRPAMMLCFVLIGISIAGMALIPSYASIGIAAPILAVTARMVQGFSLGGEAGANTAYLVEAAPRNRRGLIVSLQALSQRVALVAGGLVATLLSVWLSPAALDAYGWRVAFLIGALVVPFGFWMRSALPETLHLPEGRAGDQFSKSGTPGPGWTHARLIVLGLAVLASGTIGTYIGGSYIVTFVQATLHMSAHAGFLAQTASNLCAGAAAVLGGWLSDRYGRRPINVWSSFLLLLAIYPVFAWIIATRSEFALIAGMCILGTGNGFYSGSFFAALAESLPASIRGRGFGIVYATAIAIFGGTSQLVVTWLIHLTGSASAPAWYWMGAAAIGQVALMLMTESAPSRATLLVPSAVASPG